MPGGAFASVDGVVAVRVGHDGEGLVQHHELVDELFDTLVVHVVVSGAVDDEQMPLQLPGMCDGRSVGVTFGILLGQSHVALLINAVVEMAVRHGRDGDGGAVEIGITKERVEAAAAAAAPAPDANAF